MDISVGCKLAYSLAEPTYFILKIEAANADSQTVVRETLALPANAQGVPYESYRDPVTLTRKVRCLLGPGDVVISYDATVHVAATAADPAAVGELAFGELPMECLDYLVPSRYCPSDLFVDFSRQTFGTADPGHVRVTGICDWIYANIRYQSGSTGPASDATHVFHSRDGVCRDFAHLGITLCRALGIPARYASVYADGLSPQDFHAVFQAYLSGPDGGAWYTFDPTRMSSVDAVARIAAGHDAADVAFAWPQGDVVFTPPVVYATASGRDHTTRTNLAVST